MATNLLLTIACLQASLAIVRVDGGLLSRFTRSNNNAIPYEILNKTNEFEIRRYPSFQYATARETGVTMKSAQGKNFMKLFGYIQGKNEAKQKIPMTVPVIMPLQKAPNGEYAEDFTMMFWLPKKYQCEGCPPTPIKAEEEKNQVTIKTWGGIVYVRTYGWWPIETLVKYNENQLKQSLEKNGIRDFDANTVYSASYNDPFQIFGRKNDVMFMRTEHENNESYKYL